MPLALLSSCPDWPLAACLTRGHWAAADAEVFQNPSTNVAEHLHIYKMREGLIEYAQTRYPSLKSYSVK